MVINRIC